MFDSENMFVYISVCLVIYKFIYLGQDMTTGTLYLCY